MIKLNFRKKTIILILAFLALNVGLITCAVLLAREITTQSRQVNEFLDDLEKKSGRTEELRAALTKIRTTRQIVDPFDQYLFSDEQLLGLITDLENLASRNRVSQTILSSSLDSRSDNKVTLSLSISGTYTRVIGYLVDLEKYRFLLTAENLEFYPTGAPAEKSQDSPTTLILNLSLYVQ